MRRNSKPTLQTNKQIQLAQQHHQAGHLQDAEQIYRQILNADPNNADAYYFLGVIALQVGKFDIAIQFIKKAIQIIPNIPVCYSNLGIALKGLGRVDEAIANYNKAISINPDFTDAHNNLGIVLKSLGRLNETIASYKNAISINPNFSEAHCNLGNALRELGQLDEAVASYGKAISINPDFAQAHNNLSDALRCLGRLDEAISSCQKAISINPDFAEAHCNLGNAFNELGRLEEAVASYKKAISINPDYADAHSNLSGNLRDLGRLDEAISSCQKAISINPDFAEAHCNLGNAFNELGRLEEAVASYKKAISINPDYADAHSNLSGTLRDLGRLDEAISSCQKAISINPDFAEARCNLGNAFNELGRLEEAVASYKKAITINPDYVDALLFLSKTTKHHEHDDTTRTMEDFYFRASISSKQKIHFAFGLGKIYEDLNDYSKSFDFILEGNRLKRASYQYKIEEDIELFDKIKEVFSPVFFSNHPDVGNPDETPIFILGIPRSGTSLVEQILASHSQVFGAGELKELSSMANNTCSKWTGKKYPECLSDISKKEYFALGSNYLENIKKHSDIKRFITDKMPYNFQLIGLINLILPKAKVIHCERDPMDNCYSIYKNDFAGKHKYAYDLNELGQYYNLYLDLMDHWRKIIPEFIYDIRYEELVYDQEDQTRKLLNFCKLPWEESCLSFYKTKRRVATASSLQVRQPIYSDSVQLWKKYEKQLEPLRKALYG